MKAFRVILISAAVILLLRFSVNSLVGEERYLTLDGTVKSIEGKWWMEVESGKDTTSVRFRIGWRTVYTPHRNPQPGERVKVEYLIQRGTPIAYTVTILEREVPKDASKEIPSSVVQKQEEVKIKKPATSSESQVAERGRIVSPAPKKKREQPKPIEPGDKKIEPKIAEQPEILEKPIEPSQIAKVEEPLKVESQISTVEQTQNIPKSAKTTVPGVENIRHEGTGLGSFIIYLIPLIIGAIIGCITYWGKTDLFINGVNRFDAWVIRKRNELISQEGKGKIKRYWAMPILWILNGIIKLSEKIQKEAIRCGVKTAAYLYLLGIAVVAIYYATALVVGLIILIVILLVVGRLLRRSEKESPAPAYVEPSREDQLPCPVGVGTSTREMIFSKVHDESKKEGWPLRLYSSQKGDSPDEIEKAEERFDTEMEQGENFFAEMYKLAEDDPDQCLSKIASTLEKDEYAKSNAILRFLKGMAYMSKAVSEANKLGGDFEKQWNETNLNILEQSLAELRAAGYPDGESAHLAKTKVGNEADTAAMILDNFRPGRVQEILGKTKLKYFKDRVSILAGIAEFLIPSEEAMKIFGDVFFSVPYIARYAIVAFMQKDNKQKHYIFVHLLEEAKMKNAFGEVNKIKGAVKIFEDGTFTIEGEAKKEEVKEREELRKMSGIEDFSRFSKEKDSGGGEQEIGEYCKYHPNIPAQGVCKCGQGFCSECAVPFVGISKGTSYLCVDCAAALARKKITQSYIAAGIGAVMGVLLIKEVGVFAPILYAYVVWGTFFGWHYGGRIWEKLGKIEAWWWGFILLGLRLTVAIFVGIFGGGISQFLTYRNMLKKQSEKLTKMSGIG